MNQRLNWLFLEVFILLSITFVGSNLIQNVGPRNKRDQFCCDKLEFYFGESCCCRNRKGKLIQSASLLIDNYNFNILTIVNPNCLKNICLFGWKCPYMEMD